jgi:hypothetical protein
MVKMISADLGLKDGQSFPGMPDWSSLSNVATFPEGDVKVGDVWESELNLPGASGMPAMDLKIKSRLLELSDDQGRKCAKIRSTFSGPLTMDLSQAAKSAGSKAKEMEGSISANMQGSFISLYDYENSCYLSQGGTLVMTMSLAPTEGSPIPPGSMKMNMTMKMALVQ